jgi:hypothetical protein
MNPLAYQTPFGLMVHPTIHSELLRRSRANSATQQP